MVGLSSIQMAFEDRLASNFFSTIQILERFVIQMVFRSPLYSESGIHIPSECMFESLDYKSHLCFSALFEHRVKTMIGPSKTRNLINGWADQDYKAFLTQDIKPIFNQVTNGQ